MKKLHYSIKINAPAKKVWEAMLGKDTYMEWTQPFNPGESGSSRIEGDWSEGSKMKFIGTDENGKSGGMLSIIERNTPGEFVSIKHIGIIKEDGSEDTESDEAKKWSPAYENYTFKQLGNESELLIDVDTDDQYVEFFNSAWQKALGKLKEIAER